MATATLSKSTKCEAAKLKVGTKFSRISYGEIIRIKNAGFGENQVTVKNEEGVEWTITPSLVEAEFYTPDQYNEVEEITRTEMVQTIVGNPRIIMTINFKKAPVHKDLVSTVVGLLDDEKGGRKRPGSRTLSRKLKDATEGAERTMIGRHYSKQDEYGRIQFTDMEVSNGIPLRQVDPRTVEWAIFGNVKYVLKP